MDYLKNLGVDAIWLSPFYPSDLADGGYDVIDYRNVDPRLGTMDDFDAMAEAAHEAGIKVIVDIVPNHTADKHVFFQEALAAEPGSPARDRYIFRDGRGEHGELPPNDWQSFFGGPAWARVADGQWYLHLFDKAQPDVNWKNPDIHEEFKKTLRFWSDHGTGGFRIDVAHGLAKNVLVVGTGPAGMEAAFIAAKRGHNVVLERLGAELVDLGRRGATCHVGVDAKAGAAQPVQKLALAVDAQQDRKSVV